MRFSDRAHPVLLAIALIAAVLSCLTPAAFAAAQCSLSQKSRIAGVGGACGFSGCRFGAAVAVSDDGNTALIGAYGDNSFNGSAAVYIRSGGSWVLEQPLTPTGGAGVNRYFGCAVSLSADGNTALVGSYGDGTSLGAAYIFTRSGTVWTQQGGKLTPTGFFGPFVYFGFSVSLSADGNTAVMGAKGDGSYYGSAYVFTRTAGVWTQEGGRLVSLTGVGGAQYFGSSVAISGDGSTIIVGSEGDNVYLGSAYIFTRIAGVWTQQGPKIVAIGGIGAPQYFGASVGISTDGNTAIVGAYQDNTSIGAAYILTRTLGVWTQQAKLLPTGGIGGGRFGAAVALSRQGNNALVGAYGDNAYFGAAYAFTRSGATWTQHGAKLLPTGNVGAGQFGSAVALGPAGNTSLIGAYGENTSVGAGYIFDRPCPADFNCSASVSVADIFSFLTAWFAQDPRADFNGTGGISVADIFAFLTAWFTGC